MAETSEHSKTLSIKSKQCFDLSINNRIRIFTMNFEEQMNQGGPLFWAVTVASASVAYLALWAVMALPDVLGGV